MSKKELHNKINLLERQAFLDVYNEFDKWLTGIAGFRPASIKEGGGADDHNIITSEIDTMYGVEHYICDPLNLSLMFVREQNNHVFYITWRFFYRSEPFTVEKFKADIIKQVSEMRDNKIKALNMLLTEKIK